MAIKRSFFFLLAGSVIISTFSACKKSATSDITLELFAQGLNKPVAIVHAGDSRLFVVEQEGTITVLDSAGNADSVKFLDISPRVVAGGERGLLGMAFHPDFEINGWFYVNYIGENDSTHISRFRVSDISGIADPESEVNLITLPQPYENHNGGNLCFGPDGYLYIGLGDGGSSGDPENRAQDLNVLYGKILRIDVNSGDPYSIPSSNPFQSDMTIRPEIWAYGLRNPWRFSFDRLNGDLWISDVGQNQFEEINYQPAESSGGENYGWRCYEGENDFNLDSCDTNTAFVFPVHTYNHGIECSVTGGYVYRGKENSSYYGRYFFADFCSDKIWMLV
ncbi:MAG TPA: PQQ-dependent sugar dehydrogenase, partial [Bacteroidales bacterium]|nr:PQQ-dependent sugar dehydrogenase [Bacteroidales bacterium]